jgi:pimeloyl-ACP methyl ester carboxylesterase
MAVWIPNNESVVKPRPKQTTAWAEDQFFDSNGVQIRYIESGRGEPVVLVHGFSGNLERGWVDRGIFNKLSERYHVIAMDCRGHGKSGKPEDPEQYGAEMARDIVRLLDHLKIERAHIVGYSMGAIITAKLLTMSPDRFLTATLGGAAGFLEWTAEDERRAEGEASKIEQRNKALAAVLRSARDQVATAGQIAAVRVPTLGIVGSLDPHLASDPAGFRKFQSAMPRLKLVVVEGGDHATTSSRPEFLAALQEFLAAHPAGH